MPQTVNDDGAERRAAALALGSRVEAAGDQQDWYMALFYSAFDEHKDWRKAVAAADEAFALMPAPPEGLDGPATEEDVLELMNNLGGGPSNPPPAG